MRTVTPGMSVPRQARKFDLLAAGKPLDHQVFLAFLKGQMLASVAMGAPRPASEFIPQYQEEFSVQ